MARTSAPVIAVSLSTISHPLRGVLAHQRMHHCEGPSAFHKIANSKTIWKKRNIMADIRAFRAFRYDLGRVGALSDVVAPPYDVIDPTLQQALYDRNPYNVIRLILNKEERADNENNNRYTRAAACLRDMQREGVLVQDSARSV